MLLGYWWFYLLCVCVLRICRRFKFFECLFLGLVAGWLVDAVRLVYLVVILLSLVVICRCGG